MNRKVLVYGTLRPEFILDRYGKEIADHYQFDKEFVNLTGYKLYSYRDSYPILVETEDELRSVEFVKATVTSEEIYNWTCRMEMSAGYKVKQVTIDSEDYILFYQNESDLISSSVGLSTWEVFQKSWPEYINRNAPIKKKANKADWYNYVTNIPGGISVSPVTPSNNPSTNRRRSVNIASMRRALAQTDSLWTRSSARTDEPSINAQLHDNEDAYQTDSQLDDNEDVWPIEVAIQGTSTENSPSEPSEPF
jgi:gamma-glutamylcyclotransferase (GGCT)/AIG2-like uncharacterized protein YtfP